MRGKHTGYRRVGAVERVNRNIRWVACQIQELKLCPTKNKLKKALKSLPKGLEATYDQILQRIDPEYMPYVKTFLQWIVFGMRPLTTEELAMLRTREVSTKLRSVTQYPLHG